MTPKKIIGADQVQKLRTTRAAQAGTRSSQESWGIPCAARPIGKPMTPTIVLRFPTAGPSAAGLSCAVFLRRVGCGWREGGLNKAPGGENTVARSLKARSPWKIMQPCGGEDPRLGPWSPPRNTRGTAGIGCVLVASPTYVDHTMPLVAPR